MIEPLLTLAKARRRLAIDMAGIVVSSGAFGVVFGLAAEKAGYSIVEAIAMSTIVFAGASQFAAVGLVAAATPWPAIVLLTGFLNARHALYSAALAPWLRDVSRTKKAVMAHILTDEAFALTLTHFKRLGRVDLGGYWIAAIGSTFIPWNIATVAGFVVGGFIDTPERYGIDVVFPAAMAGLAVGLIAGRREVVAAASAVVVAVVAALAWDPRAAVVVGGLIGPLVGLAMPGDRSPAETPEDLAADPSAAGHDPGIGVAP
jgi:4-azaleucine resistance transporter AzlC